MSEEKGLRYNVGKPQYSLIDLKALEPMVKVLEFGANKYARDDWKKGLDPYKTMDSLMRHLCAILNGELIDPESGLPHIGHIQCNAMFLGRFPPNFKVKEESLMTPVLRDLIDAACIPGFVSYYLDKGNVDTNIPSTNNSNAWSYKWVNGKYELVNKNVIK